MNNDKKTILLVEDEFLIATVEASVIEGFGYEVIAVHSGEEAVEAVGRRPDIDMVLMDIDLGTGINGSEAAQRILARANVPIVFLTSHSEREMVEKVRGITRYGYVIKNSGDFVLKSSIEMAFELFEAHGNISEKMNELKASRDELARVNEELVATNEEFESANEELVSSCQELVSAEEALRISERRLETMLQTMVDGMVAVDLDGQITYSNQAAERILGIGKDIIGRFFQSREWRQLDACGEPYPSEQLPLAVALREKRAVSNVEHQVAALDGERKWLSVNAAPLFDDTGRLFGAIASFRDITGQKLMEEALRESEASVRKRLSAILSPDGDPGALALNDIIDKDALQSIMDDFYRFTNIGIGIIDLEGNVLVATGWQDICVRFHRVNPAMLRNCLESDISLSGGVEPGTYRLYRCKNNMWDIATPIVVGGRHAGNIFLGQFFFEDDPPDREEFRAQARRNGFDEEEYLAALDRVPRWSRDTVDAVMRFYVKFAHLVSTLSHGNIVLARTVAELDRVNAELRLSEERYRMLAENTSDVIWTAGLDLKTTYVSPSVARLMGDTPAEHRERSVEERYTGADLAYLFSVFSEEMKKEKDPGCDRNRSRLVEARQRRADGSFIWVEINVSAVRDAEGNITGLQGVTRDISRRKSAEEALERALEEKNSLFRELQHRIKNSLSMITAFVNFEADGAGTPAESGALANIRGRISTLSDRYSLLYDSGDAREVRLDLYLRSVSESVMASCRDGEFPVGLNYLADQISTDAKLASSLGLILNELMVNSMKYAWGGSRGGTIRVELARKDGGMTLTVADDGKGLPENFDPEKSRGFGLRLARMLAEQSRGGFAYERNGGAVFTVKVPPGNLL